MTLSFRTPHTSHDLASNLNTENLERLHYSGPSCHDVNLGVEAETHLPACHDSERTRLLNASVCEVEIASPRSCFPDG
jgi:hypothetical protein